MIAWRGALVWAWSAAVVALALLAAAQMWLAADFGWWNDELYSLWASDPSVGSEASVARLTGDSNPPLYFALLRAARGLIAEPRAAMMATSALALGAAAAFVIWTSWRASALAWGLVAVAAFAVSGPAFFFFQEARAFFLGACIAFAASWQVALMVAAADAPRRPIWLAAFGVIGSLTHFYAGLFVGCLAAALLGYSLFARRKDLRAPALVMGAAAAITFAVWFAVAAGRVANIAWIEFTPGHVREAFWYVRTLALGPAWMALPLIVLLAYAARFKTARPTLLVFAVAGALFVALPIVVSLKTPLIMGRYWAVGAPILVVLVVAVARAFVAQRETASRAAAFGAAALLVVSSMFGLAGARRFMAIEPVWEGAPLVAALAGDCPAGAVRVPDQLNLYAVAAGAREDVFVSVEGAAAIAARDAACPVIGWAEHVLRGDDYSLTAPESELLQLVGIEAAPGETRIVRHDSGFVVLAANAPPAP